MCIIITQLLCTVHARVYCASNCSIINVYNFIRLDDLYIVDMQFISSFDKPTIVYIAEVSCI